MLSQQEVADLMGISQQRVAQLERSALLKFAPLLEEYGIEAVAKSIQECLEDEDRYRRDQ